MRYLLPVFILALAACGSPDISKKGAEPVAIDTSNNGVSEAPADETPTTSEDPIVTTCGNGMLDQGEACDGDTATTCEELGFDGGTTACSDDCLVDVSACTRLTCGDGEVDEAEVCDDGPANGTYGACVGNCSGLGAYCGDGVANGPEACDGDDLAGASCSSIGYDGGELGCTGDCRLDASACTTAFCGDGIVNGTEACDDGVDNGSYGHCNAGCTGGGPRCGDGVINGGEQCDGAAVVDTCASMGAGRGDVACSSACQVDTTQCSYAPRAGEVIVSEVMQNPNISLDNDGEWFEVHNRSATTLDLDGCLVESGSSSSVESFTVLASVTIAPGGYATFARSSNAPFFADYIYNGKINLNNSVDWVQLTCTDPFTGTDVVIDRVDYDDGMTFPDPEGGSMALSSFALDAASNDVGANWCYSTSSFGVGDLGTPGAPNDC